LVYSILLYFKIFSRNTLICFNNPCHKIQNFLQLFSLFISPCHWWDFQQKNSTSYIFMIAYNFSLWVSKCSCSSWSVKWFQVRFRFTDDITHKKAYREDGLISNRHMSFVARKC
jgi:hypothetical protein